MTPEHRTVTSRIRGAGYGLGWWLHERGWSFGTTLMWWFA